MQDWRWMTAADLGRAIGAGTIDPLDLTKVYLDAIDVHPFRDRIYARVTRERALAEATAASVRAKAGLRVSPLDGVPVSWKDLFDTAGTATEAGTQYLAGRVPERDAEVLKNATAQGLVCLGKTHMTEIAFSGLGLNPKTATPPCVNDHDAVPGGSSSGAATSVAFGLAAAAVGSDTGGSVRIPSAWNDLVGLKTTHGLLSLKGVVPLCKTFDTVGPLCRSVEDAALMLGILGGRKAPDIGGADARGLTFAMLETVAMEDLRPEPAAAFAAAVAQLRDSGIEVVPVKFGPLRRAFELAGMLYTVDAYGYWQDIIEEDPSKMYHQILKRIRPGGDYAAVDYVAGWAELEEIRAEYAAVTGGFDAVVMPTAPIMPPNARRLEDDPDYFVTENLLALRNTRISNLMGGCALTLPTGAKSCGMMLNAGAGEDARLLRVGAAIAQLLA